MSVYRWRIDAAWQGTAYCGWQFQPNCESVQGAFERVLERIFGSRVSLQAAGRTDAGVHVHHQVLGLSTPRDIPESSFLRGLNGLLPEDISVLAVKKMPASFHPRHWGYKKWYRYRWLVRQAPCPFRRDFVWHMQRSINIDKMGEAAVHFQGTHDMRSFQASGCSAQTTLRTIEKVDLQQASDGEIHFDVHGNGFLRHQIRIMAGTLLDVGVGRRDADSILETLDTLDRQSAGQTAPAKGLTLMRSFCHDVSPG